MKASFWTNLFDLLSPRLCLGCSRRLMPTESVLCLSCAMHIRHTGYEQSPYDNPMARLLWGQVPIERCAAWAFYEADTQMAKMIHALKYGNRPDMAEQMGRLVARHFKEAGFFEDIDALVPVPLSDDRRRQRGYNQSELIACGIADVTGLPLYNKVLRRTSFQGSQTHLNALERRENVEHVFQLVADKREQLKGKHLLLVDDVMTTGSTLTACARQLTAVNGVKVSIFTLGFTKS